MAAITSSITEAQMLTVLRSWLMSVLDPAVTVIRGQGNRAAFPTGDVVVITPLMRVRLATTVDAFDIFNPLASTSTAVASTQAPVQADTYGPGASDNAQIITTLFRDARACEFFAASGFDVTPLYTTDPRQMAFVNGENQYEDRWSIDLHMQVNPVLTVPTQYANKVKVPATNVDVVFVGP